MSNEQQDRVDVTRDPGVGPTVAIVEAIAELENVDPSRLDFRLIDYVETDALDTVLEASAIELELEFDVENYHVSVTESVISVAKA